MRRTRRRPPTACCMRPRQPAPAALRLAPGVVRQAHALRHPWRRWRRPWKACARSVCTSVAPCSPPPRASCRCRSGQSAMRSGGCRRRRRGWAAALLPGRRRAVGAGRLASSAEEGRRSRAASLASRHRSRQKQTCACEMRDAATRSILWAPPSAMAAAAQTAPAAALALVPVARFAWPARSDCRASFQGGCAGCPTCRGARPLCKCRHS